MVKPRITGHNHFAFFSSLIFVLDLHDWKLSSSKPVNDYYKHISPFIQMRKNFPLKISVALL